MSKTEKYVAVYKELSKLPEISKARILAVEDDVQTSSIKIQVQWHCRDLVSLRKQVTETHYFVSGNSVTEFPSTPTASDVVLQSVSPSGQKTAQVIQSSTERKLLIADSNGEVSVIELKRRNEHGKVYCDPYISCLEWSSDERRIAFVAEERTVDKTTYYNTEPTGSVEGRGEKHLFVEDWGEQMVGQHQGVVVIVDLMVGTTMAISLPGKVTPGQLVWRPHSDDLVGVAYPSEPYRIGIAYCSDREAFLFRTDIKGTFEELTPRGQHVKSPRFSPSGKKLIFLQSTIYGDRAPAAQLVLMTWHTRKDELLLDYVRVSKTIKNEKEFVGVCGKTTLPHRCFDEAESRVLFSSFNLSNLVMYSIDLESKEVTEMTNPTESSIIFDLHRNWVLFMKSSITKPDRLFLGRLYPEGKMSKAIPVTPERFLKGIPTDWLELWKFRSPIKDREGNEVNLSALYFGPTKNEDGQSKRPIICWPHGGPHSLIANRFSHLLAFFVINGYSIVLPNYRGSIGHGNDFLTASLGQCGEADVEDCFQSIEECFQKYESVLDRNKIFLVGFSHGGLLSHFMAAKYPNRFKAVAVMNAASDIYIMATVSDIPDWAFLEYGLSFSLGQNLDLEAVTKMFERSPIRIIDKIKTPTLFLLGREDLRVPSSQGLYFHKMLLARNVPSRVYMYDDDHPLKKISSESDYLIQIAKWFEEHGSN